MGVEAKWVKFLITLLRLYFAGIKFRGQNSWKIRKIRKMSPSQLGGIQIGCGVVCVCGGRNLCYSLSFLTSSPHTLPSSCTNSKLSSKYQQNMKMYHRNFWKFSYVHWNVRIFLKTCENFPKISLKYIQKCHKNISKVSKSIFQDIKDKVQL